jgi:hypothetical protein
MASGCNHPMLGMAHEFAVSLSKGRHTVAVLVASGAGGWALVTEATRQAATPPQPHTPFRVEARRVFRVADPARLASVTFVGDEDGRPLLNGREIPVPLEGMRYRTVTGVPTSMLKRGRNVLTKTWTEEASRAGARVLGLRYFRGSGTVPAGAKGGDGRRAWKLEARGEVLGLRAEDAAIQSGPVLGCVTEKSFTVSCRTNMRVGVVLKAAGREVASKPGIIHRLTVGRLKAGTEYAYTLTPAGSAAAASGTVRALPASGELTFAVLSDTGPLPEVWAEVSKAVAAERPALAVFCGDMPGHGADDTAWDRAFLAPGAALFANVPFYPVLGNHDKPPLLFERIFMTPGGGLNWSQRIGGMLIIGIDGSQGWTPRSRNAKWLERLLAGSDAKFIFLFTHYPAWSSAGHGRLGADGEPVEPPVRAARDVIVPLLVKYKATAMINGHDHCYERSELPGGLTAITSGGAGAYLYRKSDESHKRNPYSKVFVSRHHYCLVHLAAETCTLKAVTPAEEVIDSRTWRARTAADE